MGALFGLLHHMRSCLFSYGLTAMRKRSICPACHDHHVSAIVTTIAILCVPSPLYAGAWTQESEQTQHFLTYRYYSTERFFDDSGELRSMEGQFSKNGLNYYVEHGYDEDLTIGMSAFLAQQRDIQRTNDDSAEVQQAQVTELTGLTQLDLFARTQLYEDDDGYVISMQPLITLPPYFLSNVPDDIPQDSLGIELGMLAGRSFPFAGRYHFAQAHLAYRYRDGILSDQYRMNVSSGFALTDRWMLMPEVSYIRNIGSIERNVVTITGQNDFDLLSVQYSALYRLNERIGIQAGVFHHVMGKNTGAGGGGLLSLWLQL